MLLALPDTQLNMLQEIKNQALILSIGTAVLYGYGITFYNHYLGYWGLEPELFALPLEKVLFQGFYGFTWLGSETLAPFALVAMAWFSISLLWFLVADKVNRYLSSKLARLRAALTSKPTTPQKSQPPDKEPPKWLLLSYHAVLGSLLSLMFFLIMLLLLLAGEHYGEKTAQKQEAKMAAAKYERTVAIKDGPILKAKVITCSSTHCALLINGKAQVYPVGDIKSITR